ncbi:uncharacterized protein LOC117303617 [Asterias rubens]|uniref:uncharacterized protein LOC117303617 n=1 Tax=Asterias rubens TaxID=7604 RepID=UPI0014552B81|nr:uncharacterized protein LOC117303617 [Asterias rubens]
MSLGWVLCTRILQHPRFRTVCLDTGVLYSAYLQYRQQYGGRGQETKQNNKHRHTAYRQLTHWCWGHLGRMVRVPLPACAVQRIRETFPSEDGQHVGYNEAAPDY